MIARVQAHISQSAFPASKNGFELVTLHDNAQSVYLPSLETQADRSSTSDGIRHFSSVQRNPNPTSKVDCPLQFLPQRKEIA